MNDAPNQPHYTPLTPKETGNLNVHNSSMDERDSTIHCPECGTVFATPYALKIHVEEDCVKNRKRKHSLDQSEDELDSFDESDDSDNKFVEDVANNTTFLQFLNEAREENEKKL